MEDNLQLSVQIYDGFSWIYTRPIVLIIIVLIVITLVLAANGVIKAKQAPGGPETGEGGAKNPFFSVPLGLLLGGLFVAAPLAAQDWEEAAQQFPVVVSIAGAILVLIVLVGDLRDLRLRVGQAPNFSAAFGAAIAEAEFFRAAQFIGYLIAVIVLSMLIGQLVVLPLFVATYLWRWGGYNWKICLGYAATAGAFIYGFYDQVMHLFFYPSLLFG